MRYFSTVQVGPKCPDISAPVPKCPKDTSDLSTKLSSPMVRTVLPNGQNCLSLWSEVSHLSLQYVGVSVFADNNTVCLSRKIDPITQVCSHSFVCVRVCSRSFSAFRVHCCVYCFMMLYQLTSINNNKNSLIANYDYFKDDRFTKCRLARLVNVWFPAKHKACIIRNATK